MLDPTTADPLYRRATRVSLGHVLRVPFARVDGGDWPRALDELRGAGFATVALTPVADAEPLGALVADAPARVALARRRRGPRPHRRRARPPPTAGSASRWPPGVDSVNVATAAAIALSALHGWG